MKTLAMEVFKQFQQSIETTYSIGEAQTISYWVFEHLGISRTELLIQPKQELPETFSNNLNAIKHRLLQHEPIQYILGYTFFYDLKLNVSPAVLIPRRETEELVERILKDQPKSHARILDIGTGSGCIALSLTKHLPQAHVMGWDISDEALSIAKTNAVQLGLSTSFAKQDILNYTTDSSMELDIIVSNPPYVLEAEANLMEQKVLDHEPHTALFVPNDNALLFYDAIAIFALQHLNPGGKLYFEINEAKGEALQLLLKKLAFQEILLFKDMQGKNRIISAVKPNINNSINHLS